MLLNIKTFTSGSGTSEAPHRTRSRKLALREENLRITSCGHISTDEHQKSFPLHQVTIVSEEHFSTLKSKSSTLKILEKEDPASSACSSADDDIKFHRKRKRENSDDEILQTQKEMLKELRKISSLQEQQLIEMRKRNKLEKKN